MLCVRFRAQARDGQIKASNPYLLTLKGSFYRQYKTF